MREKGEKEGKETWRERQGDDNTIEVTGDIWLQSQTFSYVKKQILYTPTQLSLSYFESDFFHLPLKDFFSIFLVLLTPFIVPSFKFLTFPQQWHDQLQSYGHHQCSFMGTWVKCWLPSNGATLHPCLQAAYILSTLDRILVQGFAACSLVNSDGISLRES